MSEDGDDASAAVPLVDDWLTPDGTPPERPTHVIAHLSDTHLTSAGVRYNKVSTPTRPCTGRSPYCGSRSPAVGGWTRWCCPAT